jgi:hypothetical protein
VSLVPFGAALKIAPPPWDFLADIGGGGPVPSMMKVHLRSPYTTHPTPRKSDTNPSNPTQDPPCPSTVARFHELGEATPMHHPMPHNLLHPHLPSSECPELPSCRMAMESNAVHATQTRPWQNTSIHRGASTIMYRYQGIARMLSTHDHSKLRDIEGKSS